MKNESIPRIVSLALWQKRSPRYQGVKLFFRNILNNSDYPYKKIFDLFMITLILSSVGILVYEVKHTLPHWVDVYDLYVVTMIFIVEYLLRLWVHGDLYEMVLKQYDEALILGSPINRKKVFKQFIRSKVSYMLSPSAIIDLFAILPGYRPLRVLRIFVLFRLFKLLRYTKSINEFVQVLVEKRFELLTLLFLLVFIVMTAGIAIYVYEAHVNPSIDTLFDAVYWALVTISTVGYGDISPITTEGRVVSGIIIVSGIAMISFVTSVIVSAFSIKLEELKENRYIHDLNKEEAFLILCGYGQLTKMFLRQKTDPIEYIIIDKDPVRVAAATKEGFRAIQEDASRYEVLKRFNTEYAKVTLVTLLNDDVENIYITLNAKSVDPSIQVIARISNRKMVSKYKLAGADHVLMPDDVASRMLLMAIEQPTMHEAIVHLITGQSKAKLDEVMVHSHDHYCCKSIAQIDFRAHKMLFVGLYRPENNEFLFNPAKELQTREGDVLLVVGYHVSIDQFKKDLRKVS
jgi:voltage-gated potassium channel